MNATELKQTVAAMEYLTFKLVQRNRLEKTPKTGAELQSWVTKQVENQTDLIKDMIREAIAATA